LQQANQAAQATGRAASLDAVTAAAAAQTAQLYGTAQQELQARATALVRAALDDPALMWLLPGRLQLEASAVARRVAAKAPALAQSVLGAASAAGGAAVPHLPGWATVPAHQPNSVAQIARDLTDSLTAAAERITRFADDAYRAAVAEAAARQAAGDLVPRAAQQLAWQKLMGQGITGYTDAAGRNWTLSSYTEMAVRTATARAYRDSQHERMTLMGVHWFTVSDTGRPCPLCAPWQGKVLADTGAGTFSEDGVVFDVAATITEATAAGLFHPNCKHTLVAYLTGRTVLRASTWTDADEAQYQATQRLRALERNVRAAKAQHANALTPADQAAAFRRIRQNQSAIRDHVAQNGLVRRPDRERPNLGFKQEQP
jgi:hypothetical protein